MSDKLKLSEIFEIIKPKTTIYNEFKENINGINFISSGEKNNGIVGKVEKREGYKNTDISIADMYDYITYPGFLKFIGKNFIFCMNEFSTSFLKSSFLNKAKTLIPELRSKDSYSGPAGIRAQAIKNNGELHMDFEIIRKNNQIHLLNAPSPAATASLSIADYIIENYV